MRVLELVVRGYLLAVLCLVVVIGTIVMAPLFALSLLERRP